MKTRPLHKDFGVEVQDVSLLDAICDESIFNKIQDLFETYSLVLLRNQEVSDDLQATFARGFGSLEKTKVGSGGEGSFYARMSNVDSQGNVVSADHRALLIAKANQLWHTDSSFKALPALASVLSARVIPSNGGETEFVSTRVAWDRLDRDAQETLLDKVAIHSYATSRNQIDPTMMSQAEHDALPPVRRPLTWINPTNNKRSLYIASHAGAIEGMSDKEGATLLQELMDWSTQEPYVYRHQWQQGDVLLWDNRATMHRGRPWQSQEPRSIVRITISAASKDGVESMLLS